jgi:hypothetical protein
MSATLGTLALFAAFVTFASTLDAWRQGRRVDAVFLCAAGIAMVAVLGMAWGGSAP